MGLRATLTARTSCGPCKVRIPSAPAARSASASPVTKDIPKEKGVDLRNAKGMAPLMAAVASGNEALAFELVRWKATVNLVLKVSGKADRTAMDMAACAKRTDILTRLTVAFHLTT